MKKGLSDAQVDAIINGRAFGGVAAHLMANGFNVNSLRNNATTLRHEEWQYYDKAVVDIARPTLVGVNDLRSRGLVFPLDGMANPVLAWETMSDEEDAQMAMKPEVEGRKDQPEFVMKYLPMAITFKDFEIDIRSLNASRKAGTPLDATQAQTASFKVADKIETVLFNGASSYTFGSGTIWGYTDFEHRNTISLGTDWDESAATGAIIVGKVLEMIQASIDDNHPGPWGLYVPSGYAGKMGDDYKTYGTTSIGQRIAEIDGIEFVKVAPKLTADNVVLVELSSRTVEMVIGMDITNVPWESPGGFTLHHKVMAIMVPRLKADQDGRCGIVHAS